MRSKKGFTLVELLIVIAILAILATVAIVGYTSFIDKANESNDMTLVTQLNKILQLEAIGGEKNPTMSDALEDLENNGFDVSKMEKLNVENHKLLWDSEIDRFLIVDENDEPVYLPEGHSETLKANRYEYFAFYSEVPATQTYSIYWNSDADFTADLSVGFDAGKSNSTGALKYVGSSSAQSVIIRTNGSNLTVDAANDTVKHYGKSEEVNVEKIAQNSYHEYGSIGYFEIESGRAVVESSSNIFVLYISGNGAKVDGNQGNVGEAYSASGVSNTGSLSVDTLGEGESIEDKKEEASFKFNAAVKVNDQYFATVSDALAKLDEKFGDGYLASGNAVIVLLKDVVDGGIVVKPDSNVTIDFNGFTYCISGNVGSAGTTTQGMQLNKGAKVVLKNGTLKNDISTHYVIHNYADLTLDNMVIDARSSSEFNSSDAALALDHGTVVINNTTIYARTGAPAIEISAWNPYTGSDVTIKGNSVVNGNIILCTYRVGNVDANPSTMKLRLESCTHNGNLDVEAGLSDKVIK